MNVLIIEDEIPARENMERALTRDFADLRIVGTAASVREAVAWLRTPANRADVIFMDVELSDGTCFEIFRQVDLTAQVVMTTAYDNYAVRAFEVNSIDYLLKPIDPAALQRAVERCRARIGSGDNGSDTGREGSVSGGVRQIDTERLLAALEAKPRREYKQRHIVRFNDRIVPVKTSEIAYFYAEQKNTWLVTADDNRYIMDLSLDVIGEELDERCFFRISRGCIVAMTAIVSMVKAPGNRLKIVPKPRADYEMMVSRARVDEFLRWLEGEK